MQTSNTQFAMKQYNAPQVIFVELDNADLIATSGEVKVYTEGSGNGQLGNERGGNPIWD